MDKKEFESYCMAGKIANEVREYSKGFIRRGMRLIEIAEKIDQKIQELQAKPAFPVNLSLNEIAAHYSPPLDDKTVADGLLKVDLGVEIEGCIADLAFSMDLTEKREHREMIKLNEEILETTLDSLSYESSVSDVGNKISSLLEAKQFNIIKNLTGHSLGKYLIHSDISIPNTFNLNKTVLKENAIAIEPFLTTGVGEVIEGKPSEIFMLLKEKNVRDSESRKIISFIKQEYQKKPFCKRWLDQQGFKTKFALSSLVKEGLLYNFPVLVEKSKGVVSQAEETVVLFSGKKVITTKQNI